MDLELSTRTAGKKSEINKIRRQGNIPAIIYFRGENSKAAIVDGGAFRSILNSTEQGTLSSKVFTLKYEGKEHRAIIKDIQYNITTYDVIHLDFERLEENTPVTLNIPLKCTGIMECSGVKLGGVLRQPIRSVKVKVLPKHIPDRFELDVRDLNLGQSKRLNEISVPSEVHPVSNLNEIAVVVARR